MAKNSAVRKILHAFALQLVLISGVTVLGVLVTYWIVEDLLSQEALREESEHYWKLYQQNPNTPLPNTANLMGYMGYMGSTTDMGSTPSAVSPPQELLKLAPGYGRVTLGESRPLVHVSDRFSHRLYLVFAQEQVSALTFYFGLVPLILVLMAIYLLAFLTYRSSHRTLSPFVALADYLEGFEFRRGTQVNVQQFVTPGNTEINSLVEAVSHFASGWEAALEREAVFTRDASHELRTPVAVFKGSLDLLEQRSDRPQHEQDALQRMRRTVNEMEALLNTLLLLAREPEPHAEPTACNLVAVVDHQLEVSQARAAAKGIELVREVADATAAELEVAAPTQVAEILVGNLLRNAISYTRNGSVLLRVEQNNLLVKDSGVGIPPQEVSEVFNAFFRGAQGRAAAPGHGLGLALVKRIVDRYGWAVRVDSKLGLGTEFRVDFAPAAANTDEKADASAAAKSRATV